MTSYPQTIFILLQRLQHTLRGTSFRTALYQSHVVPSHVGDFRYPSVRVAIQDFSTYPGSFGFISPSILSCHHAQVKAETCSFTALCTCDYHFSRTHIFYTSYIWPLFTFPLLAFSKNAGLRKRKNVVSFEPPMLRMAQGKLRTLFFLGGK